MHWSCDIEESFKSGLIDFKGWTKRLKEELKLNFTPPLKKLCEARKLRDFEGVTYFLLPGCKYTAKVPGLGFPDYVCLSTRAFIPEFFKAEAEDFPNSAIKDWALDDSLQYRTLESGLVVPACAIYESCELDKEKDYACVVHEVNEGEDIYLHPVDYTIIIRAPLAADTVLACGDDARLRFARRGRPAAEPMFSLEGKCGDCKKQSDA